ncbi:hypothetical protein [Pseudorhodoplanes sp.]|uniref:hypothetical protein n=1 Tax=Pseudorhodoplanes sp. TaxID=1934341 RepID=UPI003D0EDC2F
MTSGEAGGWLWILIDIGAVLLLAIALGYGVWNWRVRRSPAADRLRDRKTVELHQQRDPDEGAPLKGP